LLFLVNAAKAEEENFERFQVIKGKKKRKHQKEESADIKQNSSADDLSFNPTFEIGLGFYIRNFSVQQINGKKFLKETYYTHKHKIQHNQTAQNHLKIEKPIEDIIIHDLKEGKFSGSPAQIIIKSQFLHKGLDLEIGPEKFKSFKMGLNLMVGYHMGNIEIKSMHKKHPLLSQNISLNGLNLLITPTFGVYSENMAIGFFLGTEFINFNHSYHYKKENQTEIFDNHGHKEHLEHITKEVKSDVAFAQKWFFVFGPYFEYKISNQIILNMQFKMNFSKFKTIGKKNGASTESSSF